MPIISIWTWVRPPSVTEPPGRETNVPHPRVPAAGNGGGEQQLDIPVAELVGTAAGLCSTGSFIPQVVKAWRRDDVAAISKRMYIITVSAFTLWTAYGLMIGSIPIIAFNIVSLLLSGTILVLKVRGREGKGQCRPST